jgi:hypothetical protein
MLWSHPDMPKHWIVDDATSPTQWWAFPADEDGWRQRKPFEADLDQLRETPPGFAAGTGWPGVPVEPIGDPVTPPLPRQVNARWAAPRVVKRHNR